MLSADPQDSDLILIIMDQICTGLVLILLLKFLGHHRRLRHLHRLINICILIFLSLLMKLR